jgi:hypothetical protein
MMMLMESWTTMNVGFIQLPAPCPCRQASVIFPEITFESDIFFIHVLLILLVI